MSDDFDNDLSWLNDDDSDESGKDDELSGDWKQSGDKKGSRPGEERLGVTGELSWRQDRDDDSDTPRKRDDLPVFDWEQSGDDDAPRPDQNRTGVTGELSWVQGVHDRFEDQIEAAEEAARQRGEQPPPEEVSPHDAPTRVVPPDGLSGKGSLRDRLSRETPPTAETPDEADAEQGGFDDLPEWMRDMAPDAPVAEEPGYTSQIDESSFDDAGDDVPEWMREDTGFPDVSDETFDEGYASDDAPAVDDDVPEWMKTGGLAARDEAEQSDDDNVPEWMRTGVYAVTDDVTTYDEEVEDAPDWMKTGGLAAGDEVTPAEDDDVPEWMKTGGLAELDDELTAEAIIPGEDVPDWVKGSVFTDEVTYQDTLPSADDVPDWLADADSFSETTTPQAARRGDTSNLPDWLQGDAAPPESAVPPADLGGDDFGGLYTEEDIYEEEAAAEQPHSEDLFADLDDFPPLEPVIDEETDYTDLFGDEDFGTGQTEEEFDLLGELTGDDAAFDDLPDFDDSGFDLLGELSEDEPAVQPADAFAEMPEAATDDFSDLFGDETEDTEDIFGEPAAEAVIAEDDFANLFGDDETEEADDLFGEPAAEFEEAFPAAQVIDADDDLGSLFGDDEPEEADDLFGEPAAAYEEAFPAEQVTSADDDFGSLFGDDEPEEADDLFGEPAVEAESGFPDDDFGDLFGTDDTAEEEAEKVDTGFLRGLGLDFGDDDDVAVDVPAATPEEVNLEEDAFRWFGDEEAPAVPAASSDDMDWLSELQPEGQQEVLPADDDFLRDLDMPAAPEAEEEYDVEQFLASLDEKSLALPDTGELDLGVDVDLDDSFLGDIEPERPSFIPAELTPDAPDWLADVSRSVSDHSAAALVRRQKDRPVEELPDRLRALRDRGLELPATSAEEALPAVIFEPGTTAATTALILTDDQRRRSELLRTIVGASVDTGEEAAPAPSVAAQRRRLPIERVAVGLLLVVMMLLPFIHHALHIGSLPPAQFGAASRQQTFFDQIDQLQPGQFVLIAAEYGPTGAAELDDATEALLLHSLLRGARPVVVGGNPIGLLRVDNILSRIADVNTLQPNLDYYVGQYLVADVIGLRAFGENIGRLTRTNIRGEETGLRIDSLDQFALIVVITERADRLRGWAEQVLPLTRAPLLAVTGYGAAPLSQPYLEATSAAVAGMLVGYGDAYTYRRLVNVLMYGEEPPTETPAEQPTVTPDDTTEVEIPPVEGEVTEEPAAPPTETSLPTEPPTEQPTETATPTSTPTVTATATPTHTPSPTPTPEPVRFGIVVADGRINIRSGPSTSDAPVTSIAPGDRVLIVGENEDESWYQVLTEDGIGGWVAGFLLRIEVVIPGSDDANTDADQSGADAAWKVIRPLLKPVARQQEDETPAPPVDEAPFDEEGGLREPTNTPQQALPPFMQGTPVLTPEAEGETQPPEAVEPEEDAALLTPAAPVDVSRFVDREIVAPERTGGEYRDERWYSMTIGIIVSVVVIALGNIINILRALLRRRDR